MSEKRIQYFVPGQSADSVDELLKRRCCLPCTDLRYKPPTGYEIESLMTLMDWSRNYLARLIGIDTSDDGSATLQRWKCFGASKQSEIPYAYWRLALVEAGLVQTSNNSVVY